MRPRQSPAPCGLGSWGRNVSGAAGVGQRTQRFAYSEARRAFTLPLTTLPTRANRGVSRPAPAAPVPPRAYECIEHRTLFLGMLAPMPITLRPVAMETAPFGQICSSSAPVACATRRACAHANHLRPAAMGTAPFGQISCSSAPVACATRRTCAHANHAAPCGLRDCPFGQICCSSAPVACATRRTCAHANHLRPAGLVLVGAM